MSKYRPDDLPFWADKKLQAKLEERERLRKHYTAVRKLNKIECEVAGKRMSDIERMEYDAMRFELEKDLIPTMTRQRRFIS